MDITQLFVTLGAVVGIVIVGLLAIVPTLIELPERTHRSESTGAEPTPLRPRRDHHDVLDLAA